MGATVRGRIGWKLETSDDNYRTYKLRNLVKTDSPLDGPYTVMNAAGLPRRGTHWAFGNDLDINAYCYPTISVAPVYDIEKCIWWVTEQTFSTKPLVADGSGDNNGGGGGGGGIVISVSGSFEYITKKTSKNRLGKLIKSSSHEPIEVDKEITRPTVVIEQNVVDLGPGGFAEMVTMVNSLNDAGLWGLPKRTIKLKNMQWSRNLFDPVNVYKRTLTFEARWNGTDTFDIDDILDCGWKVLRGKWVGNTWTPDPDADVNNPEDFIIFKDKYGERYSEKTALKNGLPLTDPTDPQFLPPVEQEPERNFFLLGIPTTL